MARWPNDDPASLAAFYGDPNTGEPGRQLVPVVPPFQMYYEGKPIKAIQFHRKAAGALKAALDEIWETCGRNQATVDRYRLSHYSGAYNPRKVRGSDTKWSNHAYGAAIDLDADHNGFNTGRGTMPEFAVAAFKRQGALWGGDYRVRTDPMHFEFCSRAGSPPSPPPPKPAPKPQPAPEPVIVPHAEEHEEPAPAPVPAPAPAPAPVPAPVEEKSPGFFGRFRNRIAGLFTSGGFLGLGALSDWKIAALLFGALLSFLMLGFVLALWLFGKDKVRDWIARHIA